MSLLFYVGLIMYALLRASLSKDSERFARAQSNAGVTVISAMSMSLFDVLVRFGIYRWASGFTEGLDFDKAVWWHWVVGIVLVDLAYYWNHRVAHRMPLMWAIHAVHHQPEDMNFTVSGRHSILLPFMMVPFDLPLALLGVPWEMFLAGKLATALHQMWLHTETLGSLGPFGWIFNTPAFHRVHHVRLANQANRNYCAIFIVWDRLFGSFAREREREPFGVHTPLAQWNPVWAWVQPWRELAVELRRQPTLWRKFTFLFWVPTGYQPVEPPRETLPRARVDVSTGLKVYLVANTLLLLFGLAPLARLVAIQQSQFIVLVVILMFSALAWGYLLDRRWWAWALEGARWAALAACLAWVALDRPPQGPTEVSSRAPVVSRNALPATSPGDRSELCVS